MNSAQVISVNPCSKTAAELNGGDSCIYNLGRRLMRVSVAKPRTHEVINFITGINSGTSRQFSLKMLAIRVTAGALLLFLGILTLDLTAPGIASVAMTALGASLVLGWFTRIVSAASLGAFAYTTYLTAMAGDIPYAGAMLILASLIFAVFGPGRLSLDQIFRHVIIMGKRKCRRSARRRSHRIVLDYRAYEQAGL